MDRLSQSNSAQAEPFAELPFPEFCERYLKIQTKTGEVAPLQLNRAQQQLIANLTGRDIVLKARQLGVSTVIQALHFYEQMQGNTRTSTLCHEDELTATLRSMADRFYQELPDTNREQHPRKYANAKMTTYAELNSESSIATVGGQAGSKKGRGGSVTRIHGSEVAFWPNAQSVMAAAMQAGSPDIVLESTPNGMVGYFYELCMEALDSNSIWTLHFFPWWYDDDYQIALDVGETLTYTADEQALAEAHSLTPAQIKWRRYKQRELKDEFAQEYPEDPYSCFLASGNSYFGDVSAAMVAPRGIQPGNDQYVIGLDFGQTTDYTVAIVGSRQTRAMVDMLRINQQSWASIRRAIRDLAKRWNNADVYAELNSIGSPNIEALTDAGVRVFSFKTTAQSKPPLIQGLRYALQEGGLTIWDDAVLRHELRAFISKQLPSGAWQYAAQDGAHDDTVIALAIMWHGMNARRGGGNL